MNRVIHTIPPIFGPSSRTLILGTMPSPRSREACFYYAHPQNRFWRALAAVYGESVPETNAARASLILRHGLALWDVLHSCNITGAADASIRRPVANDIAGLVKSTGITRVFTTGKTAAKLYAELLAEDVGLPCTALPSPSSANARMPLNALIEIYRAALTGQPPRP